MGCVSMMESMGGYIGGCLWAYLLSGRGGLVGR